MFNQEQLATIKKLITQVVDEMVVKQVFQSDIRPKTIKRRHIEDNVIIFGLSADRPTNGGNVGVYVYFATDTGVLGCWDGSQWLETTLS